MSDFYDRLTPFYHLIHQDWHASVELQGGQLSALIEAEWPGAGKLLDVSCGIGTQAIGLARRGYSVAASDLSAKEVERARREAAAAGVDVAFSVCDMRRAHDHHGAGFDVVLSGDNSLPHLLTDDDILVALRQMLACLSPDGGCLITLRDYEREERGVNLVKPYGVRTENGKRYLLFQVWDFEGEHYDLVFYFIEEDLASGAVQTHAMRSRYYAISTAKMCELMREAGFDDVRRIDGAFYQPVLVGTRPGLA
ncbi:class I SAM-dependent methyltransferase [Pseudoduganella namucuonensis]|uniref:Methyltransferase domain-containing protein n=1 Tax=Pseudoduganella namucuonensis TaxID=1035707 RepID=A0A1I7KWR8_9BURK|nr:class I SAM-dependent methyltransferase [Pseudoduganella namucuonensis]SFV01756.1 Methyltransferase domain-containing protein [Pseudoduganella namucuonensis]